MKQTLNSTTSQVSEKISSLCGLGRISKFPGTLASIASLIFSILCFYFFNETIYAVLFLFFLFIGFWAISELQKNMDNQYGEVDYSWIVIDEWIGMWFVGFIFFDIRVVFTYRIFILLVGFIIFRLIDIFKFIPPIKFIDQREKQTAHEIILDDMIAGVYTYAIILFFLSFYNGYYLFAAILFLIAPMVANATPVLLRKIDILNFPINEKIFGKNKTWRGLVGGTLVGIIFYFILIKLVLLKIGTHTFPNIYYTFLVGFLLSFGALTGDIVKSFFKRQANIPDGKSFPPWDQIDYILGAIVFTYLLAPYSLRDIVLYLIIGGTISALAHRFSYFVKLINTKY